MQYADAVQPICPQNHENENNLGMITTNDLMQRLSFYHDRRRLIHSLPEMDRRMELRQRFWSQNSAEESKPHWSKNGRARQIVVIIYGSKNHQACSIKEVGLPVSKNMHNKNTVRRYSYKYIQPWAKRYAGKTMEAWHVHLHLIDRFQFVFEKRATDTYIVHLPPLD